MKKLNLINVENDMYIVQGTKNSNLVNKLSKSQFVKLLNNNNVVIENCMEDDLEIMAATVEEYDDVYDVVVYQWIIKSESQEQQYKEVDELFKTYKREKAAYKYANKF